LFLRGKAVSDTTHKGYNWGRILGNSAYVLKFAIKVY
jgi:hypothetical protein